MYNLNQILNQVNDMYTINILISILIIFFVIDLVLLVYNHIKIKRLQKSYDLLIKLNSHIESIYNHNIHFSLYKK